MSPKVTHNFKACLAALPPIFLLCSEATATSSSLTDPSFFTNFISWIISHQREFHNELISSLKLLKTGGSSIATGGLITGSFFYGIFHAAGPGHGKAVLTTYLLTRPHRLRRSISIAVAGALCQGVTAVTLVYGLIYLAGWIPRETSLAVSWSERLSYLLVAAIGSVLIVREVRQLIHQLSSRPPTISSHGHSHEHIECCGHNHMPNGDQLEKINGFLSALGVVLAIGLRPCTGAVLILIFAKAIGLPLAGVTAVLVMSVGTGMTVTALALIAVNVRHRTLSFRMNNTPYWQMTVKGITIAGGSILMIIGISLLSASFYSRHPLGL